MKTLKFPELEKRYSDHTLTVDDLSGASVSFSDWIKLREANPDVLCYGYHGQPSEEFAPKADSGAKRTFRYTMVTQSPIGFFQDVPIIKGFNLEEYEQRKSPVLYAHNMDEERPPVGRGFALSKNSRVKGFNALTGNVRFRDEGKDDFVDFIVAAIEDGFLNGGSVGFRILRSRKPTESERKRYELGEYATIFDATSLREFSIVPLGRDPLAIVQKFAACREELEAWLEGKAGAGIDAELIRRFRMELMGDPSDRTTVVMGDGETADEGEAETVETEVEEQGDVEAAEEQTEEEETSVLEVARAAMSDRFDPEALLRELLLSRGVAGDEADSVLEYADERAQENRERSATYGELQARDQRIGDLERQIAAQGAEIRELRAELEALHAGGDSDDELERYIHELEELADGDGESDDGEGEGQRGVESLDELYV